MVGNWKNIHNMYPHRCEIDFKNILQGLNFRHNVHIPEYGVGNENRLTGEHETQHIGKFSWGVGDRGASVRVPISVEASNWMGYLEDRRPASNCDPYRVARVIIETVSGRNYES